jgi:hypothetical protein
MDDHGTQGVHSNCSLGRRKRFFLHGLTQINAWIYADEILIRDELYFPENSDNPGIHRESHPARYISGQELKQSALKALRIARICRSIPYQGKAKTSALICVHLRPSEVKKQFSVRSCIIPAA